MQRPMFFWPVYRSCNIAWGSWCLVMVSRMWQYQTATMPSPRATSSVPYSERTHLVWDWWLFSGCICHATTGDIYNSLVAFLFEKTLFAWRDRWAACSWPLRLGKCPFKWCYLIYLITWNFRDALKGQCHGNLVLFQKPKNVFGLTETAKFIMV